MGELAELEAQVATPHPANQADSIQTMMTTLNNVLKDMKATIAIPPELIVDAETHMTNLMTGIQTITQMAQASVAAAPACEEPTELPLDTAAPMSVEDGRRVRRTASDPYDPDHRRTALRAKTPAPASGFYATLPDNAAT
jgi:hypothetical protein